MRIIQRQTLGLNMQRETYTFFTFWITEFSEVFKLIIFSRNLLCSQNVGYHLSPSQKEHLFVNKWVLVMKFTRRVSKNFSHITIDHDLCIATEVCILSFIQDSQWDLYRRISRWCSILTVTMLALGSSSLRGRLIMSALRGRKDTPTSSKSLLPSLQILNVIQLSSLCR